MSKFVIIDCGEGISFNSNDAIVVVDVIRSTTLVATIIAEGRRCFFAPSVEEAFKIAVGLDNPLLVGESGGIIPKGFEINNSPVEIENRRDIERPAIIVSTSGIPFLYSLNAHNSLFVACLRNYGATTKYLKGRYDRIALLGAPHKGEFREEDQICCAWIAHGLRLAGYKSENRQTNEIINRWKKASADVCAQGKSADCLRATGQTRDLTYVLDHINDLNAVLIVRKNEIMQIQQ